MMASRQQAACHVARVLWTALAACLLHVTIVSAQTTPAPAASAFTRNLKKLEDCAGGARVAAEAPLALFEATELADARSFRLAVARRLSGVVFKAIGCVVPHTVSLLAVGNKVLWGASKCVMQSLGSLTAMSTCFVVLTAKVSWPLIKIIAKVSVCIIKINAGATTVGAATSSTAKPSSDEDYEPDD